MAGSITGHRFRLTCVLVSSLYFIVFDTEIGLGAKCVVVSLDHRLAPEYPFPAALTDAVDALKWVFTSRFEELNINTKKIAVGGCSRCV